jgi:hypothetical protein
MVDYKQAAEYHRLESKRHSRNAMIAAGFAIAFAVVTVGFVIWG